jgi:hypothetical protein
MFADMALPAVFHLQASAAAFLLPAILASIESVVILVSIVEACQLLVLQALNTLLFRLVLFSGVRVLWRASRTFNELRWEQKLLSTSSGASILFIFLQIFFHII